MKKNLEITLVGGKGSLNGNPVLLKELYDDFRIKHPNAFHIRMASRFKFDGYIKYINQYGDFNIGLLKSVYDKASDKKSKIKIIDNRLPLPKPKLVTKLGGYELRDVQIEALKHFINYKIGDLPFYIGVMNCATNFGKTLLMAAIHEAFGRKLKTLVLINNSNIFKQAKKEYKEYLPGEDIRFVQGKEREFGNFTVGMVQTISQNLKQLKSQLSKVDIVLVDEADVADNKQYTKTLLQLYNARVRLGLSGSIYMSKLKKDLVHNMNLRSYFGDEIMVVTKSEMVKKGYSTPIVVKICKGNEKEINNRSYPTFLDSYKNLIINNDKAKEASFKRTLYNIKYNRLPSIILTKYIDHAEALFQYYGKRLYEENLTKLRVYKLDHTSKDKDWVLDRFNKGYVDILIITYIIKRGVNLPKSIYLQNASGSDSEEDITQIMGRLERTHRGKIKAYIDDLYYYGQYIERHSKHRIKYYKNTGMKVINLLKRKV